MSNRVLPLELQRVGESLFVRPHKAGQLLENTRCQRGATGGRRLGNRLYRTFMNNSPSSESMFTVGNAWVFGIERNGWGNSSQGGEFKGKKGRARPGSRA